MGSHQEVILRFDKVSFGHGPIKAVLEEASFTLRSGMKVALMGQNGAGKTTIFNLISGKLQPESGTVIKNKDISIAVSRQIVPEEEKDLTIKEFFEKSFSQASFAKASAGRGKIYDIDPKIAKILDVVHLEVDPARPVRSLSGGQQARLLLASALIQEPDLLLLDEPTNNLDRQGLEHLEEFLKNYGGTCIVISHDAEFLNSFTQGVLYLDVFTRKVEQYVGNYFNVVKDISARIERERMKNVRLEKDISHRKEQANFFGQKGGHLRDVARKMREKIEELDEEKVEVRREDKTIRKFLIPCQEDLSGQLISIKSVTLLKKGKPVEVKTDAVLKRKGHLLLKGPNGIGKTTLLEAIANGTAKGAVITEGIRVGYYRQDFSTLDMKATVYEALAEVMKEGSEQTLRSVAAGFLLDASAIKSPVGALSEGQKALVMFARLVLLKPGLLILDEPTNHVNFRHLPVIAAALDQYEGAMILVSHVEDFVKQIRIDDVVDLGALVGSL